MRSIVKLFIGICSMALILSGCSSGKGSGNEAIKVATVTTTESAIMGNMIKLMIERLNALELRLISTLR